MRTNEAAGGVVVGPDKRILMVEQHRNSWGLPKGGVEEGESLVAAAQREIAEETGITELAYTGELGSYERLSIGPGGVGETDAYGVRRRTFFLFTTAQTELSWHDSGLEITDARWVTIDEALALMTHPKDRAFLESVRARIEAAVQ